MTEKSSNGSTWAVSLTNFLDSGSIVAGASGLTLWQKSFGLSNFEVGLLGALSANAFGSALGAIIGGRLSDKFGRKMIYTYDMLIYMLGTFNSRFFSEFCNATFRLFSYRNCGWGWGACILDVYWRNFW